jgi:hypothetical protein
MESMPMMIWVARGGSGAGESEVSVLCGAGGGLTVHAAVTSTDTNAATACRLRCRLGTPIRVAIRRRDAVGADLHTAEMVVPIIGSEAGAAGVVTPYALRTEFMSVYPGVHVPRGAQLSAAVRAQSAWLWSRRRGVVAGQSAAAWHGAKWVRPNAPAELIHDNRHPPAGIRTWADALADDEVIVLRGVPVTTPARTALDLARRYSVERAVAAIDALANATRLKPAEIDELVGRYRGHRGIALARDSLRLVDAGAESPRETWLRLLLIRNGFPPPITQFVVRDEFGQVIARLDMAWPDLKIAIEYEGDHHRTDRRQFNRDIRRVDALTELGWVVIRVTAEDTEGAIIHWVANARARRV